MSQSFSVRTLSEFQADESVIDLTDYNIVLQFAQCVRHLSPTRLQSIWSQNVQLHHTVQSQTKLQHQIDDILLFLIIIYGKEQYPQEEEQLIAKLKVFITSSPFVSMKKYIQQKYFPLLRDEFVNNKNYFASMIEDYATTKLSINTSISHTQPQYSKTSSSSITANAIIGLESTIIYHKLEEKMMELFASKFNALENKINNIEKDVQSIKYAMIDEAKQNVSVNTKIMNIEDIVDEINIIKKEINKSKTNKSKGNKSKTNKSKTNKIKNRHGNNCGIDKKESIKVRSHKRKKPSVKKTRKSPKPKRQSSQLTVLEIEKRKKELNKWMKNIELIQYFDMFVENGIDNLSILKHVSITDLALLGIDNLAHKVKIMQNIQRLKYEQQQNQIDKIATP